MNPFYIALLCIGLAVVIYFMYAIAEIMILSLDEESLEEWEAFNNAFGGGK